MKITPQGGPAVSQPPTAQAEIQSSPRERAIAKLMGETPLSQSQQHPVSNPSQVSPEEMSVVQPPEEPRQNDSVEPPQEDTPTEKVEPLSTQFAQLARKEKALRAKAQAAEAAAKAREAELLAREEALKAKESEYLTNYIPKSRFKADPLSVLTEEGISYDEITQAILNPQAQQDPRVLAEIEKLKSELNQQKQYQEEQQKQQVAAQKMQYDQAVAQIRQDTRQLVEQDPAFETIKETGSIDDVVDLIERTYHQDKILLTVEEAAKEVEEYLIEQALRLAKINKIRTRLSPAEQAQKQPVAQKQPQSMNTLTNAVNASKPMSARERAIAAFKGNRN